MLPTIFDLMPAAPADEGDFAPARRFGAAGAIGRYVAGGLWEGRYLFSVLQDEFVLDRIDEEPDLLGRLAADTLVRDALERLGETAAMPSMLAA